MRGLYRDFVHLVIISKILSVWGFRTSGTELVKYYLYGDFVQTEPEKSIRKKSDRPEKSIQGYKYHESITIVQAAKF